MCFNCNGCSYQYCLYVAVIVLTRYCLLNFCRRFVLLFISNTEEYSGFWCSLIGLCLIGWLVYFRSVFGLYFQWLNFFLFHCSRCFFCLIRHSSATLKWSLFFIIELLVKFSFSFLISSKIFSVTELYYVWHNIQENEWSLSCKFSRNSLSWFPTDGSM